MIGRWIWEIILSCSCLLWIELFHFDLRSDQKYLKIDSNSNHFGGKQPMLFTMKGSEIMPLIPYSKQSEASVALSASLREREMVL